MYYVNLSLLLFCSNKVTQLKSENRALKKKRLIEEKDVGRRPPEGKQRNTKFVLPSFPCSAFLPSFILSSYLPPCFFLSTLSSFHFFSFPLCSHYFSLPSVASFIACMYVLAANFLLSLSPLSITYHKRFRIFFFPAGR